MVMIKAIIFDLWKTLIYAKCENVDNEFSDIFCVEKEKWKRIRDEFLLVKETGNIEESIIFACKKLDIEDRTKINEVVEFIKEDLRNVKLYSDSLAIIGLLREKNFKLGLISNVSTPYKEPFYSLGLADGYFDTIFFSCERGIAKPQKEAYLSVIKELNVKPEETLMIGDNLELDVKEPVKAGLNAMLLDRKCEYSNQGVKRLINLRELLFYI
jgi:HAD superfamily hydrolase (TIGR01549 family)